MDPKATIDSAQAAFAEGNLRECAEFLLHYSTWRARGGFEPYIGADKTAEEMFDKITAEAIYQDMEWEGDFVAGLDDLVDADDLEA
jgi:hypothetical protein